MWEHVARLPCNFTKEKSTLLKVRAWCRKAISHYLIKCWPGPLSPYGVIRPQRVYTSWFDDCNNWIYSARCTLWEGETWVIVWSIPVYPLYRNALSTGILILALLADMVPRNATCNLLLSHWINSFVYIQIVQVNATPLCVWGLS